ncbi:membrane lipoprotein lipid attachment site-containing protein [Halobacillus halophilus]|uniref:membrane lipoprotein lipid attachment site-containing protein n=1 Tax=Halobacillus halophilus TaxID=1570 RepID=UPI001CD2B72B|nr:membrane lipoprotein lipid attachment site-containing protein [Halobacillus halophilus]MCA1010522.1 membrane lipoprotein lipid attachment site-containing protein [Halobacillus halophilus]
MKRFVILIGLTLLLAGCTNEGGNETGQAQEGNDGQKASSSSLVVKPAKLSKREKMLVNQIGIDYQTFFTVDGKVPEGEALISTIEVYENGELINDITTQSTAEENTKYKKALHSFQVRMGEAMNDLTIGGPDGYVAGQAEQPKDLKAFLFEHPEERVTLNKGETIYWAYVIGSSQGQLSGRGTEDLKTLPPSVKNEDYAIVFKMELNDEK